MCSSRQRRPRIPAVTRAITNQTRSGSMNVIAEFMNGFWYISANFFISATLASICA
jgi:hypothetical protein